MNAFEYSLEVVSCINDYISEQKNSTETRAALVTLFQSDNQLNISDEDYDLLYLMLIALCDQCLHKHMDWQPLQLDLLNTHLAGDKAIDRLQAIVDTELDVGPDFSMAVLVCLQTGLTGKYFKRRDKLNRIYDYFSDRANHDVVEHPISFGTSKKFHFNRIDIVMWFIVILTGLMFAVFLFSYRSEYKQLLVSAHQFLQALNLLPGVGL